MTATNPEIKAALMSRGIWPDFVRLREDAKRRDGGTSRTQTLAALEALGPAAEDLIPLARPKGRPPKTKAPLADVKRSEKDARRVEEGLKWQTHGVESEPKGVRARVPKDVFAGKTCSISTAFMWAYSNLCFADAAPEDAPSAVAWQMYVDMTTSPSLKADMLKSGLGAAMRKAEAEDETNGRFDGEGEYDVLAAIAGGGGER